MSDDDSAEEMYSITSSQAVYKRSRPSTTIRESEWRPLTKQVLRSEERRHSESYLPVAKWAVDYNNRNYIRSQCNKNKGLHRKIRGRPVDWQIEYDNNYHTRSKINAPKGLHRRKPEIKRKYAPEKDDLADATGWEFDCGPEYDQEEQDVTFIPEGRIIARGCYRWYGVRRNNSDCDVRQEEHRENLLNEELEAELKYGHEFLQADIPHMSEQPNKQYSRGGYRFYEVPRNVYDIKSEELASVIHDPEWRRKYHSNGIQYLDVEMCNYDLDEVSDHRIVKGKPFKRTILNKVYELRKRQDSRESAARHATRLSLVPGEGERTLYEGMSDRYQFGTKRTPSIRSAFKKKSERQRYQSMEGSEYEEYEREDKRERYTELKPKYEDRMHRMAAEKRMSRGRPSFYDEEEARRKGRGKFNEYSYRAKTEDEPESRNRRSASRRRGSPRDVREDFETWRQNAENSRREQEREAHRVKDRRPVERKTEESSRNYSYSSRDTNTANIRREREDLVKGRRLQSRISEPSSRDYGPREIVVEKRSARGKEYDYGDRRLRGRGYDSEELHPARTTKGKDKVMKKMPPHVEKRVKEIREKMEKKLELMDHKYSDDQEAFSRSSDSVDLMKHKGHPGDRGESHNSEYEKYVTKNDSEFWVKEKEKFAELHHKGFR